MTAKEYLMQYRDAVRRAKAAEDLKKSIWYIERLIKECEK